MSASDNPPEVKNKILSLQHKRQEQNKKARKTYLTTDERVLELEQEMVRVIDMLIEQNATLDSQSRLIKSLTRVLVAIGHQLEEAEASVVVSEDLVTEKHP